MNQVHQPKTNQTAELKPESGIVRTYFTKGAATFPKEKGSCAYEETVGNHTSYRVWASTTGEFYNPFDVDNRNEYSWLKVKKNVFDLYMKFLKENRVAVMEEAQRTHTFND